MTGIYMDVIIGLLALVLGYFMIKDKLGRHIMFVNPKKYDSEKVSKIAGIHMISYGFIAIILCIARYITDGSDIGNALNKASLVVLIGIGASIYYNIRKHGKLEKKEESKDKNKKKKKKKKKKKRK